RRHTRWPRDWSSDVCSSDLQSRVGEAPVKGLLQSDTRSQELRNNGFALPAPQAHVLAQEHAKIAGRLFFPAPFHGFLSRLETHRSEERRVGKECKSRWWRGR